MINEDIYREAYKLNSRLVDLITNRDLNQLQSNFDINLEIFIEIEEVINDVGIDLKKLDLKISSRGLSDIWKFENGNYGIEVELITINGNSTHLTLITELKKVENEYKLEFRQIEVM